MKNSLNKIEICVNFDGVPLTKSSGSQFYPVLCSLYSKPSEVPVIVIYHRYHKPNDINDLLYDFIGKVCDYGNNGCIFNERNYQFKVKILFLMQLQRVL